MSGKITTNFGERIKRYIREGEDFQATMVAREADILCAKKDAEIKAKDREIAELKTWVKEGIQHQADLNTLRTKALKLADAVDVLERKWQHCPLCKRHTRYGAHAPDCPVTIAQRLKEESHA